jgi:integrase
MPRRSKGARLWYEHEERGREGRLRRRGGWTIRDGSRKIRTGCALEDRRAAEEKLAEYIATKYQPSRERGRHPSKVLIDDVLNLYLTDVAKEHAQPAETAQRANTLGEWWGTRTLADVSGKTCRDYVAWRIGQPWRSSKPEHTGKPPRLVSVAAARRELEDLRSAINHHRREGYCSEIIAVWLPDAARPRGEGEDYFLRRRQAARLLWAAWRARQVMRDNTTQRAVGKHLARFILTGLYTGTRHRAICTAAFQPAIGRGYVDIDAGVFHRQAQGVRLTKKRQPPVRLPPRLLAHLRRWHRLGISTHAVVEWNGKAIKSIRKSFAAAVAASGIGAEFDRPVVPHILRHTAATWLMQRGTDLWEAAGFLGMTPEMLLRVYGHHHPDFQRDAAERLGGQHGDRLTVNKSR